MYLLDTMVVSELRERPRRRDRNVIRWFGQVPASDVFVSVLSIGEIERGIERQRLIDPPFAARLANWLDVTLRAYGDRILPIDIPVARRWGRLSHQIGTKSLDLAIAATAIEHGLTVATRNLAHFAPTGVPVINPFEHAAR